MLKAAIFDMDGLLINSEPLWCIAEHEVFASLGFDLSSDCSETVGLGLREMVALRYSQRPWNGPSREEVAHRIHLRVIELIRERGVPMPGAAQAIAFARQKGARIALATASDAPIIEAALGRLGLLKAFDAIQSAAELPRGKPHPEVYLRAAAALGVAPERSVAFEDSLPGLIAAKAAKMVAVSVPDPSLRGDPRIQIADLVLESLVALDDQAWQTLSRTVYPHL